MRAYQLTAFGLDNLHLTEFADIEPRDGEALVAIGAVSLNYRDLALVRGQMPLQRRLPKVGFRKFNALDLEIVNVTKLNTLPAGSTVTAASLKAAGIISRIGRDGVKLLGNGELTVKLTVQLERVSASARAKVEALGGVVEGGE